jgi:soluble lytic murein transglycosylase
LTGGNFISWRALRFAAAGAAPLVLAAVLALPLHAQSDDDGESSEKFEQGLSSARATDAGTRAVAMILNRQYEAAVGAARASGSPAAEKVVEWYYIRDKFREAGYPRIMRFLTENPGWPAEKAFISRAQILLWENNAGPDALAQHFAVYEPVASEGYAAKARLMLAQGNQQEARRLVREAWLMKSLKTDTEQEIAREFASLLGPADHEARLWAMVMAQDTAQAARASRYLSANHQAAAKAAAQMLAKGGSDQGYKALPKAMQQEPAMRYVRARWFRVQNKYTAARDMLLASPKTHAEQINPEQWFIEKRIVTRYLLSGKQHDPRNAYRLAASHGFTKGKHFEEGEFLAGFVALRYLNDTKSAAKHFRRLAEGASNRTEGSRGYYWLGRALDAQGDKQGARQAYAAAANSPTLFYGQLAMDKIGKGRDNVEISRVRFTDADMAATRGDSLMAGMLLIERAGGEGSLGVFLEPLAQRLKTPGQLAAAASLLAKTGEPYLAVRFAKAALVRGVDLDEWAYPVNILPKWRPAGPPVERAMVYGLARQESEFFPLAKSPVGALGLMQLMPATAKTVASRYGVSGHSTERLTRDPAHNLTLGQAHLGELVKGYRGSYILTFAAYNAGPGRVRQWIDLYGDPRTAIDPVDWIELVPVAETRRYMQKVMQNVHIYRARLGEPNQLMVADLARGGAGGNATASTTPAVAAPAPAALAVQPAPAPAADGCAGQKKSIASLITGGC